MASPIGHALCGVCCLIVAARIIPARAAAFNWREAILFVVLANLPDIDFLIGYLVASDTHAFHRGPTHSLLFAVAAGFLIALALRWRPGLWQTSTVFSLTIMSHDIVDLLTGERPGVHPSYGVPLLWPFESENFSAPISLFFGVKHDTLERLVSLHNLKVMGVEVAMFAPLLILALWLSKSDRATGSDSSGHETRPRNKEE